MDKNNEIKKLIETFHSEYTRNGEPIRINFREIISELNSTERYSHLIHSYPAKLLCHIPYFFLQTDYFCPKNGVVLDPFCGTGTVMLEANISGRNAKGADANPLACLISRVKTTYIKKEDLQKTLGTIISRAKRFNTNECLDTPSISRWFSKSTIMQLWHLECAIKKVRNTKHQDFFMVCLSNLVKKVSFADPSISVPVKLNPETSKEGAEIAQRYGVQGFPTILFISADGFVLENIGGYVEGEKFVPYMKNAIEKLNKINIVLASKEPSLEKLDLYLESGNEEEAKKIYDVLMDRKAISNEAMAKYLLGFGLIRAQKRDYEKANEYFDNIIKNYPKSEEVYVAHYYKVVIMALAGEKDEPKKYLEKLIDDPKVPANMKAQYESLLSYINEKN